MQVQLCDLALVLRELLADQRYAILGTLGADRLRLNLMAVASTNDLRSVVLATERTTTKYHNLKNDSRVSLLVDNRTNQSADTAIAFALCIDGVAEEASGPERQTLANLLLDRHPQMREFVCSPACALFLVRVQRYELVRGLYDVRVVDLD